MSIAFQTPDWEQRIDAGGFPLDLDHYLPLLNQKRIEQSVQIFGRLRIPDLAGQPPMFEAGADWMFNVVRLAAGGLTPEGKQLVQTLTISVPKKNSKTSGGAALMITLMLMSPRPNAEFLFIAPRQPIAEIAFRQAAGIIRADPFLAKQFRIREHIKRIEHTRSGSYLSVKSFSDEILTGAKCSAVLLDEIHLLDRDDHARIVGQLRGAGAAISEAQLIQITTASDKPPSGYWLQELRKARAIRNGEADVENYLALMWEPPSSYMTGDLKDVCQPELWAKVNPNLGYSVSMDWLKTDFKQSLAQGTDEVRRWLSQHANVEISRFAGGSELWPGAEVWHTAADVRIDKQWMLNNCVQFALGFDGGGRDDLSSLQVIGTDEENTWYVWGHSWVWKEAISMRKDVVGMLKKFEDDGDLTLVDGATEVESMVAMVREFHEAAPANFKFGLDPNGIASEVALACEEHVPRNSILSVRQGFALRQGWLALDRRIRQGRLVHGGQPIMEWAASNCKQDPKNGLVTKKINGLGKIDPAVAAATAAIVALEQPEPVADMSWFFDVG